MRLNYVLVAIKLYRYYTPTCVHRNYYYFGRKIILKSPQYYTAWLGGVEYWDDRALLCMTLYC